MSSSSAPTAAGVSSASAATPKRFCQGCGKELPPNKPPSPPRKWCSEKCRKASYGDPCIDCGTRTTFGAVHARVPSPRCPKCTYAHRSAEHRALIEGLWADGKTGREIAEATGTTSLNFSTLRANGYNLPHRRTAEQLARITAGSAERLAKARAAYAEQRAAA